MDDCIRFVWSDWYVLFWKLGSSCRMKTTDNLPLSVTAPPDANCYPTASRLICVWSNGLEFSPGCAALDASGLLSSVFLWPEDYIVWLRLGWECFWVDYLEGVLYKSTIIIIIIMIVFFLVLGQLWPRTGPLHLLVLLDWIVSLLLFVFLSSLLPYSSLSFSVALSLTFFLELKCTESASIWLETYEVLYTNTIGGDASVYSVGRVQVEKAMKYWFILYRDLWIDSAVVVFSCWRSKDWGLNFNTLIYVRSKYDVMNQISLELHLFLC